MSARDDYPLLADWERHGDPSPIGHQCIEALDEIDRLRTVAEAARPASRIVIYGPGINQDQSIWVIWDRFRAAVDALGKPGEIPTRP